VKKVAAATKIIYKQNFQSIQTLKWRKFIKYGHSAWILFDESVLAIICGQNLIGIKYYVLYDKIYVHTYVMLK
jgi:hypothetical protein